MLEDAQYKFVISESKLSTIDNEKKQEIEDLKEKVCGHVTVRTKWDNSRGSYSFRVQSYM